MLFDLQGKRRRVVQATYLTLAVLMGGGLVLFGIGGDVSGGLFDAFSDRSATGNGNDVVEKRIDRNEAKVKQTPGNEAARKALVRDYYQLATAQTTGNATGFPDEAKDELRASSRNWKAYLALEPKRVDTSLALLALQVHDVGALNKPKDALVAARFIAEEQEDSSAYLRVVQYAALAGDTRVADLAGQKAVDLAPKAERKNVKAQVELAKKPQTQGGAAGAAQGGAAAP
jgi:hypothetical protein